MKKRILHVLSSNDVAGAENVAMDIINLSTERFHCAYASPKGEIKEVLRQREIEYLAMDKLSISHLKKVIKDFRPNIIHAHDFTATILCLFSTWRIPIVSHIHQNPPWLRRFNKHSFLYFLACFKLYNILAVTPAIKEGTFLSIFFTKKTVTLQNIVHIESIQQKSREHSSNEQFDLVFIGRYEDVKDPLRFIEIVSRIKKELPSLRVAMLGGGSLEEECKKYIKEKKLENNVRIKLFVKNPFPILARSKIFVMTSKSEGSPMVLLEALALGKPVIAPTLLGLETIVNKEVGYLCADEEEYVERITALLRNEITYVSMSEAASKRARELCDIDKYKQLLHRVYQSAL